MDFIPINHLEYHYVIKQIVDQNGKERPEQSDIYSQNDHIVNEHHVMDAELDFVLLSVFEHHVYRGGDGQYEAGQNAEKSYCRRQNFN